MDSIFRRRRSLTAFIAASISLCLVFLAAGSDTATAKGRMRAVLDPPIPADAKPGTAITVNWRIEVENSRSHKYEPFGAGEVFVRLIAPARDQSTEAVVDGNGTFSASMRVPAGGVERVEIGIKGYSANGARSTSDFLIPITGRAIEPAVDADRGEFPGSILAIGIVAVLATMGLAYAATRRRRRPIAAAR